jgi:hypothetical protein
LAVKLLRLPQGVLSESLARLEKTAVFQKNGPGVQMHACLAGFCQNGKKRRRALNFFRVGGIDVRLYELFNFTPRGLTHSVADPGH